MGGVWLLFALVQLVATIQEPRVLPSVLLALAAVLSVTYLVPAVVLLRRQRSAEDGPDGKAGVLPD